MRACNIVPWGPQTLCYRRCSIEKGHPDAVLRRQSQRMLVGGVDGVEMQSHMAPFPAVCISADVFF